MSNPLVAAFTAKHGTAPFPAIKTEHYLPAFEKAFELAKKAKGMAPNSIGNNLTLGELYYWSGDYENARKIFSFMQGLNPRPNHYTLDQYEIQKAANYLSKIDNEIFQTRNSR